MAVETRTAPVAPTRASLVRSLVPIALTAAALALVPLWLSDSDFRMGLALEGLLFTAYAIAFNLIFGSTKQLFLCVGALAGVGGYTAAILADRVGLPMLLALVLAAGAAAVTGGLFSWVAVRRSLDVIFTGIITLTFSLAFQNLILGQRNLTGGETGLLVDTGAGTILREPVPAYYVFLGIVVTYLVVFRLLQRSHVGWAFRALRDDEVAAELAGVNVPRYRIYAGLVGSGMLGLAGAFFAFTEGFISASTFSFGHVDIRVLVMVVFGGLGTLLGPVLGATVFSVIDEVLIGVGQLRQVVYGLVVIAFFVGFKHGLVPAIETLVRTIAGRMGARIGTKGD
ncbi:MAG: branched-chain amino acid ABC transporter permease [Acidobacteria bacterium]|nr:branched-chain amino acid ABC transporter permease [Acidobacteriota bacterium]